MIKTNSNIYIAGHNGLVGNAIYRRLRSEGYKNIFVKSRKDLELNDDQFIIRNRFFFRKSSFIIK